MIEGTVKNEAQGIGKRKRMIKIIIGIAIGGVCGFLYYRIVGCSTGTCPITSNPWISTLYGAIAGALVAGL